MASTLQRAHEKTDTDSSDSETWQESCNLSAILQINAFAGQNEKSIYHIGDVPAIIPPYTAMR